MGAILNICVLFMIFALSVVANPALQQIAGKDSLTKEIPVRPKDDEPADAPPADAPPAEGATSAPTTTAAPDASETTVSPGSDGSIMKSSLFVSVAALLPVFLVNMITNN